jgi:hypothetical protein
MTIVGFNFTKISVEKRAPVKGKISISNNVAIKDVEKIDLALGSSKQEGLRFVFTFTSKYEPDVGDIELTGEVLYLAEAKQAKEILDSWKKDKRVSNDIMSLILNTVLSRCNIEALIVSKDVNLPPPIPLPKVNIEDVTVSKGAVKETKKK